MMRVISMNNVELRRKRQWTATLPPRTAISRQFFLRFLGELNFSEYINLWLIGEIII